jgi:tetratricopeptide (TPR) repeat protein
MFRSVIVSALIIFSQQTAGATWQAPHEDVREVLTSASALYFEAKFKESIDLLLPLDDKLHAENGPVQEKTGVKLQLALAYIGLNDAAHAKSSSDELFAIDPDYSLNTDEYPPKVVTLAEEAKADQSKARTERMCDDSRKLLESENAAGLADQILAMRSKCPDLGIFAFKAADAAYKKGIDAYKREQLADAMRQFRAALKLNPDHEFAAQYTELVQQKLRVSADRVFLDWRKKFDAGEYSSAATSYRQLQSLNVESGLAPMLDQTRSEYRQVLVAFADSWNRACQSGDASGMDTIRRRATELLPEPSMGQEILGRMTCAPKPAVQAAQASPASSSSQGCVAMDFPLAMVRLKTRVDPVAPAVVYSLLRRAPLTVRVKTRIDESGNVTVRETQGENAALNEAVRSALERWKFSPAIVQNVTRCVETEIPIAISLDSVSR